VIDDNATVTIDLAGLRMLVVDDEPMVRHVFRRWLTAEGASVVDAESVTAACSLLAGGSKFDLVITDHRMPGLSGADLVEWVRKRWPDLPVLVFSGVPSIAERREVIEKPVRGPDLKAAIVDLLSERQQTARNVTRIPRPPSP
jgi:CheY-like chemotaxis protein